MPDEEIHTRLRAMFTAHYEFIWRSLRRVGLTDDQADDAAQKVFIVASEKLDTIRTDSEKSFLFGTAMRVASDLRRSAPYRRELVQVDLGDDLAVGVREKESAQPDELLDQQRARRMLDDVLETMDLDLRSVFVLYELEEMTTIEIATLLEIPHGTAQSRLRRAREEFQSKVALMKKQSSTNPNRESAKPARPAKPARRWKARRATSGGGR